MSILPIFFYVIENILQNFKKMNVMTRILDIFL